MMTALDSLIRSFDKRPTKGLLKEYEVIVQLVLNPRRRFWERPNELYFVVSLRAECSATMTAEITEMFRGRRLALRIAYRVRAAFEAPAQKIAEGLQHAEGPQAGLEQLIRAEILEFVNRHGGPEALINDFLIERKAIEEGVAQWMRQHVGLDLSLTIDLQGEKGPYSVALQEPLPTSEAPFCVGFEVRADVLIEDLLTFIQRSPSFADPQNEIVSRMRQILHAVVKAHSPKDWYFDFDNKQANGLRSIESEIREQIRQSLAEIGCVLQSFSINHDTEPLRHLLQLREARPILVIPITRAAIEVKVAYRVISVSEDLWHRFVSARPNLETLNEWIRLHLQQSFADEDPASFRKRAAREVMEQLNDPTSTHSVTSRIAAEFGLDIHIDHWVRNRSEIEMQQNLLREVAERAVVEHQQRLVEFWRPKVANRLAQTWS